MHASSSRRRYLACGMLVPCQHHDARKYFFSASTELTIWYIIIEATYSFVHKYCVVSFARASPNNSLHISLRVPTDSRLNFPLPIFHPPIFNWYPLNKNVFVMVVFVSTSLMAIFLSGLYMQSHSLLCCSSTTSQCVIVVQFILDS